MSDTTTKTLRFWLRKEDISEADLKDLYDLSRELGAAHRVFVETWLRMAFDGEVSSNDRFRLARREYQKAFAESPYVLRFGNTHTGEVVQKDIKVQWGRIRKGEKGSVSFGPGRGATIEWLANANGKAAGCQVEQVDGRWYMTGAEIRKHEGAAKRTSRRWELVPQTPRRYPWKAKQRLEQLGKATKIKRVKLKHKDRGWEAQVVVALPVAVAKAAEECPCGVDVGMRHLLVASIPSVRKALFLGHDECARLWDELDRRAAQRKVLYKQGKRDAARARGDKCARIREHICEVVSRRFVDWCVLNRVSVVRMEDLSGIRRCTEDTVWNWRLSRWPYYHLQQRVEQKLAEVNIPVEYHAAAGTSQTCSACGYRHKDNRHGVQFRCLKCGYECHADLNAANVHASIEPEDDAEETLAVAVAIQTPAELRPGEVGHDPGLSRDCPGKVTRLRRGVPEPCTHVAMTL